MWRARTRLASARARRRQLRLPRPPRHAPFHPHTQPFVDAAHPLQSLFPERRWAIVVPTVLFVGAVTVAGTLVGAVMVLGKKRR